MSLPLIMVSPQLTKSISYSMSLREIDNMRVDGKFVDADGNKAEGQYVSLREPFMFVSSRCTRPCCSFSEGRISSSTA